MNSAILASLSSRKNRGERPADIGISSTTLRINREAGRDESKLVASGAEYHPTPEAVSETRKRSKGKGQSKPFTSWPKQELASTAPQSKNRDTDVCSICRRLESGIRLSRIFVCDTCEERLGTENVMEINEMWF